MNDTPLRDLLFALAVIMVYAILLAISVIGMYEAPPL